MTDTPVTRLRLFAYGLPAMPLAAMYLPVFVFVSEFYAAERGVALATIGAILLGVRVFDAVSDPIMGLISDRWATKFGRRRPWLVLSAPFVMLAAWNLFVPPDGAGSGWLLVWLFVLTLAWTAAITPYFAWGAEVSTDYVERARVAVWRESLGLVGTMLVAVLYNSGADKAEGMERIALLVVVLLPVAVAICVTLVPEPKDFSERPPKMTALWTILRTNPLFRRLLTAYFINGAANGVASTLFIFFVSYRLDAPDMVGILLLIYFGSAVLGAPIWTWAAGRMTKHRVWCIAMIYAGLVFFWTIALGGGDWVGFAVICVLSGLALGADLALPSAIQADMVDVATAESGSQQTGAFFAIWSVATKLALAVAGAASLIYLDLVGFEIDGLDGRLELALLYALGPIVLKMIAVWLMWSFPMDRAETERLRGVIEGRT